MNVELREARPTTPSLFALSEARRIARKLGATVYALVVGEAMLPLADTLGDWLGKAGADKVLLLADPPAARCPAAPLWKDVIDLIAERLRPRLVLFAAGSVGLQLGPICAIRCGASYFPRATVDLADGGPEGEPRLTLRRWSHGLDGYFSAGIGSAFAPVVATLGAGVPALDPGAGPAEIAVLHEGRPARGVELLASEPAPDAAADLAATVVIVGEDESPALASHRPDALVVPEAEARALLEQASPRLVVLTSTRAAAATVARLRVAPDAHVVAIVPPRRPAPRAPLIDRVWRVERARAIDHLAAALATPEPPR